MSAVLRCSTAGCGLLLHAPGNHPLGPLACPLCGTPLQAPEAPAASSGTTPAFLSPAAPRSDTVTVDQPSAGTDPSARRIDPLPARIGRFTIRRFLGEGGFGSVYEAHDPQVDRVVALKVAKAGSTRSTNRAKRFVREARAAGNLRHPHVVPVFDAGQDGEFLYIAMAYIPGQSLEEYVRTRAAVDYRQVATLVRKVAEALAYAHGRKVIHRDVKPANVMIDEDGEPLLMDFGMAARQEGEERLTQDGGTGIGTPAYVSPEQAAGRPTAASDQYGLGCTLYELLTGQTPFAGPPDLQLFLHQTQDVGPPRQRKADVPRDLETICLKCLHKDPARRYGGCQELADDLRRWLDGEPIKARRATLRERLVRWRKRRPATAAVGMVVLALTVMAALAGGWYWDRYHKVKVEYHAQYVARHGVREGVVRLREDEVRGRKYSYKSYVRGGLVEQMDVVNGAGELTPGHGGMAQLEADNARTSGRECRYLFKRNQRGELLEEQALDRNGRLLWILHYTTPTTAHYTNAQGIPIAAGAASAVEEGATKDDRKESGKAITGLPEARTRSGASYLHFVRSAEGFDEQVLYLDRSGHRIPDDNNTWGQRYERDGRGLVVRKTYLGRDGKATIHKGQRFAIAHYRHDARGNPVEYAYFDDQGAPCLHKDGLHRLTKRYDRRGNAIEWAYFDGGGAPCLSTRGYHRLAYRYDQRGHETEVACFGVEGTPCVDTADGAHRIARKHDARGLVSEARYFGIDGAPCLCKGGYHKFTSNFDELGNPTEEAYYGVGDQPCTSKEGYQRFERKYDARGNGVEWRYFGVDGRPCLNLNGLHSMTKRYDEGGYQVEWACFGVDGLPCLSTWGYHRNEGRYDERGNAVEWRYYGVDGHPCLNHDGLHRMTKRRDERGNQVEWACFGIDGLPCLSRWGHHQEKCKHDERGNQIEWACFGVDGLPCVKNNGYHQTRCKYDARGHQVEWACFGLDGLPCLDRRDGTHRTVWRYDERGHRVETAHFCPDGNPCVNRNGLHRMTNRYDESGHRVEWASFGVDGLPCVDRSDGAHRMVARYDERGHRIEAAYFGRDGRPCLNSDGLHRMTKRFDERGNQVEWACFGVDGQPCVNNKGFHQDKCAYDDRGDLIEWACFGVDGLPCLDRRDGTHRANHRYDERGNRIASSYFGPDGKPCLTTNGEARWTAKYDALGNKREQTYYALDDRPRVTRVFDEKGNPIQVIRHAEDAAATKGP